MLERVARRTQPFLPPTGIFWDRQVCKLGFQSAQGFHESGLCLKNAAETGVQWTIQAETVGVYSWLAGIPDSEFTVEKESRRSANSTIAHEFAHACLAMAGRSRNQMKGLVAFWEAMSEQGV